MAGLKLFLLGPPRIELHDAPVDLQRRKALALLVYLAVSGQVHSRDALATFFWPELDQQRGRAYLRRDLAVLNTRLPGGWLSADRETVELNHEAGPWLDIGQFQGLLAACREHGHAAEIVCAECVRRLTEAVALYSGDFLAGFTLRDSPDFDDWQFFQTESLRQELATALEWLVQGLKAQGKVEAAIPHARRRVALDPLHEPAQRALIQLYDRAGQPAAGLRQYEEYGKLLEEELGLPPEEETTTLYEAIKAKRLLGSFIKAEEQRSKKAAERKQAEAQKQPGESLPPGGVPALIGEALTSAKPETPGSGVGIPSLAQQIRYCRTADGVRLAYATVGHGPPLVKTANWLSHLEYDWQSPVWRHWLEGLAGHHTLVRYDKRGCGLSDRDIEDFTLSAQVADLETVVDALGLSRFPLLGLSGGGPVALAYAVRHPEKVSHLILYGSYVRGRLKRSENLEQFEEVQMMLKMMELGWGKANPAFRQVYTSLFIPEGTTEQIHWFNELQRISTAPKIAARMATASYSVDVSDLAPQITVPTLVLHARDDAIVAFEQSRQLATLIPGVRFVPLESKNHILLEHEPAWPQFLAEVHQFLGVEPEGQPGSLASPKRQTFSIPTPTLTAPPIPLFVARHQELAQLDTCLEAALRGESRVVFVTGEAGQGKSALLQAFARRAQLAQPDLIVAHGTCNAYTGIGDPYLPFREILELLTGAIETQTAARMLPAEQAERLQRLMPHSVGALVGEGPDLLDIFIPAKVLLSRATAHAPRGAAWLNELQALVTLKSKHPDSPAVQQAALFEQYLKVVQALSRQIPLLLLLDDLQWADRGSINLLFHLGRRLAGHRFLIVGAYRPADVAIGRDGERHPLAFVVNEFQRQFGDISLNLAEAEGEAFVNALLDSEPNQLSNAFRASLFQLTEGHPLFTIELLRGMQERGDLVKDEAGRWVEQPGLDWQKLPARVEGAIGERISRLAQPLRELLRVAGVEGEEFTAEVVARVLGVDPHLVVRQLSGELDKRHQLVQAQGLKQEGTLRLSRYRFRHILIQRYLYQSLDEVERVHLNEALGNAFETLYSEQTDPIAIQLAWHYQEAGILAKAVHYLLQAGRRASRLSANEEAIAHLQQCLTLLKALPDTPERARQELEAQIALGPVLVVARGYSVPEVKQTYSRARELIRHGQETPELFRVLFGLWGFYLVSAELPTTRELGEQALDLARRLKDPVLLLEAHRALGMTLFHLGEFALAREQLEQGAHLYDPQQHRSLAFLSVADPGVTCLAYLARTLWHLGFPNQALEMIYQALDLARDLSHPFSLAAAMVYTARVHQCCRDAPATLAQAEAAIALSIEHGFPHYISMGTILQGWATVQQGNVETGIAQIRQGLSVGHSTQIKIARTHFLAMLAEAHGQAGQVEEGLKVLAEALASIEQSFERQWQAELYRLKGEMLLVARNGSHNQDEVSTPEACFLQALTLARQQGSKALELRATVSLSHLWREQGQAAEARQRLSDIYGWFSEGFDTVDLQEAKALLETLGSAVKQRNPKTA